MRTAKIFFLAAVASGFGILVMTGCSKSSSSTPASTSDSVYSSPWITLSTPLNNTDSLYEETLSAPAVTSAILNTGVVLGYGAYVSTQGDTVEEAALEFDIYQTFSVGSILLQSNYDNSGLFYRYVIIPGNVLATTGMTRQQVKNMTYTEVTKVLSNAAKQSSSPSIP